MGKFVIECPSCGKYAEASSGLFGTGLFGSRKIQCSCGNVINVRADKLSARTCPHCGNSVVFDQSKGDKAKCPVCHEPINTIAEQTNVEEFSCAQCGIRLMVSKNAATFTCPACDHVNNVQERLASEKARKSGLASIIKYEGDNETLVWKHPIEDFNMGSQLIVHESQEAIFFRDGQALDLFGAGRYTLETQKLPMMDKLYPLPTDAEHTFHSEVYYINLTTQMGIKWGTDSKVRMFDPATGLSVDLGASGEFHIRVIDSRKLLLKTVGTAGGLAQKELLGAGAGTRGMFRALVMTQVKSFLAHTIREQNISVLEVDEHLMEISEALRDQLNQGLAEYGLTLPQFYVSRIILPDDDPNFRRMREQHAERYLRVEQERILKAEAAAAMERKAVEAQTEAQMKVIGAQGEAEALRIQRQAEAEAYKMQAAAEAEEMRMKGFNYQQQTAREVSLEAMKNGIVSENGGSGLGDIVGLGVGLGAMTGVMGQTQQAFNNAFDGNGPFGGGGGGTRMVPAGAASGSGTDTWNCAACGTQGITSRFCPECGAKRPEPPKDVWVCPVCGKQDITSKFCPECGTKRPEPPKDVWVCPVCGKQDITTKFCPECGAKRPEAEQPQSWDCECGQKGITGKFCPECGRKRGE